MNFTDIPFDNIVKFGQRTMLDFQVFSISWILGRFCNYQCSYCWPYARRNVPDYQTLDVYKNAVFEIKKQARLNNFLNFHWSFSGGEPTAYKNLIDLISSISDETSSHSLHMTTNLSPGTQFWKNWELNTKSFYRRSITASFHAEFADENEFCDKILMLMESDIIITVNQVMVPDQFYDLYERCERFNDKGINVTLKPQSDPTASFVVQGYTPEMMQIMQTGFPQKHNNSPIYQIVLYDKTNQEYLFDQAERFNAFGFNKFKGWICNSGFQSIIIRENEIKRSYSCSDKPLGTLTEGFTLFKEPRICITDSCVSSADSKIPKCINTTI